MATGLLTAALAASLALAVWIAWRARARTERAEEARRALDALVEQGSDLLAASLMTLDASMRRGDATGELGHARDATRGAARLLEAAHAYAAHPERRLPRAEGCVRVGVGLARSRGVRVLLSGASTQLRSDGGVEVTCRTIAELLAHAAQARGADEVLELTFADQHLQISCGERPLPVLEPRHRQGLDACGWVVSVEAQAWRVSVPLEPGTTPGHGAVPADVLAP
jgi:hypothetical protein